jgi:hypothetical protein
MSDDAEAKAKELAALLEQIFGKEQEASLPDDPWDFEAESVQNWKDVAAALAAYPKGLPAGKKNQLLKRCMELTKSESPNPDLSVRTARMPVLGGASTRVATQAIQAAPKRRTGLTRAGTPAVAAGPRNTKGIQVKKLIPGYMQEEPTNSGNVATPQKLRQLEVSARMQQNKLDELSHGDSLYASVKAQTLRAWTQLLEALEGRKAFLSKQDANDPSLRAYQGAITQVHDIVAKLKD